MGSNGSSFDDNTNQDALKKSIDCDSNGSFENSLAVHPIGTIRSVYRLCVGTPRQGLLAPSARGCIHLHKLGNYSTQEAVRGLEGFSYVWIVFVFHLNTQSASKSRRFKSKISPPALGGQRVGIYATRSPHRINPIGITLCKLDRIQVDGPHQVMLLVSGLDLVDGTPVLDIKPYVPAYDSVASTSTFTSPTTLPPPRVPEWVDGGLNTFRDVFVTEKAATQLQDIISQNPMALDFYGPHRGDMTKEETSKSLLSCITQVLSMDVRSSYQTQKTRKGQFQAERTARIQCQFRIPQKDEVEKTLQALPGCCTQQLDNLLIDYQVQETGRPKLGASEQSGAEDSIVVHRIRLLSTSCSNG